MDRGESNRDLEGATAVVIDVAGDSTAPPHAAPHAPHAPITRAGPTLFCTGRIPKESLGSVIRGGIRSIVCLSEPHEAGYCDEAKMLARYQIDLHHAPVCHDGWGNMMVTRHLTQLDTAAAPSLVYCDSGLRAAVLCIAYNETRGKLPANMLPAYKPLDAKKMAGDLESGFAVDADRTAAIEKVMMDQYNTHTLAMFLKDHVQRSVAPDAKTVDAQGRIRLPGVSLVLSGLLCQSDYVDMATAGVRTVVNLRVKPAGDAASPPVAATAYFADSAVSGPAVALAAGVEFVNMEFPAAGFRKAVYDALLKLERPVVLHLTTGDTELALGADVQGFMPPPEGVDPLKHSRGLEEASPPEKTPWGAWLRVVAVAVCMGVAFGVAMESGKVTLPVVIRQQFLFQRFIMLKMFLAAAGGGAIFLAATSLAAPETFGEVREVFMGCGAGKGLVGVGAGAFLLGVGMALGGACPGMVLIQIGSGVENSGFTFLGGAVAALVYGFTQPMVMPMLTPGTCKKIKLEDIPILRSVPYWVLAAGVGAMCFCVILLIELLAPWESDSELPKLPNGEFLTPWKQAWPPILSGVIIGLMQVPAVLGLGDTLGSSSAYMTVNAQLLNVFPESFREGAARHLEGFRSGTGNWWQVFYIVAAILGSLASSRITGTYGIATGVPLSHAILGGFTMIFGSRMASGCTSGHGLSGMALLAVQSFVAVPAMFAGGIVTAFAMQAADPAFTESLLPP